LNAHPAGLIFEAVYAGLHDATACEIVDCPCQALRQPFADPRIERLVWVRQLERGLTVEEARASLKDW